MTRILIDFVFKISLLIFPPLILIIRPCHNSCERCWICSCMRLSAAYLVALIRSVVALKVYSGTGWCVKYAHQVVALYARECGICSNFMPVLARNPSAAFLVASKNRNLLPICDKYSPPFDLQVYGALFRRRCFYGKYWILHNWGLISRTLWRYAVKTRFRGCLNNMLKTTCWINFSENSFVPICRV